ncbi:sec-independent protein translocase protein TatA [Agromyces terreus]|uniref:Sec-independent protein translocase protein TatA n=1 Tax=Agromyces terreus TaxID=424795 RepID=A0A9X2GZF3_9MICO|nr:twin-arginine translocase TatA/TatE family subunit [Agromyces terreus]MCP2371940.1 sec-independent protein translocase protein TatA [Agromyces terreus]
MFANLTGWHFLIILVIILLLFGAPKLPALARSLGQSMKILKSEVRDPEADAKDGTAGSAGDDAASTPPAATADGTKKPDSSSGA